MGPRVGGIGGEPRRAGRWSWRHANANHGALAQHVLVISCDGCVGNANGIGATFDDAVATCALFFQVLAFLLIRRWSTSTSTTSLFGSMITISFSKRFSTNDGSSIVSRKPSKLQSLLCVPDEDKDLVV